MQDCVRHSAAIMPRWLSIIRHCISLITCCALVVFVVILWQQRTAYLRWEAELSHTLELRSRIAELDQVLTVNAILHMICPAQKVERPAHRSGHGDRSPLREAP